MEIRVFRNNASIYLLKLSGALDLSTSDKIKDLVMEIIKTRAEAFIINLADVSSVDSSGVGALLSVFSTLKKLGCPLVIIVPEGPVTQALEATRLKGYFTIACSLKEALSLTGRSA